MNETPLPTARPDSRQLVEAGARTAIFELFLREAPLEATYRELAQTLASALGFPIAAVELLDRGKGVMRFVGVAGMPGIDVGLCVPVDQTLSGTVATSGHEICESATGQRPEYQFESLRRLGVETFVCVPLVAGADVIGTLAVADQHRRDDAAEWMPHLRAVATTLALQIRRREAEEALRQSQERFRLAMEASRDGLWDWNVATGEVYYSPAYSAMLGLAPSEAPQRLDTWSERIHPEDREATIRVNSDCIENRRDAFEVEFRMRASTGEWRWILGRGRAVSRDADGRATRIIGTHTDITERKRTEAALEERVLALTRPVDDQGGVTFEELFSLPDIQRLQDEFARATGVASIITRPDGTPLTQPSGFCRLCRDVIRSTERGLANCYRSDAVLGQPSPHGPTIQPCMSGGLWDAGAAITVGGRQIANWLIGQVRDATQTEDGIRAYAREIGADEEQMAAAFREVPAMSREQFGHVAQVLFTLATQLSSHAYQNVQQARFITERRRAEEEKARLEAQLAQAQKMESVGRLAGGVAHDFNNMLQAILGHVELAFAEVPEGSPAHESLSEIRSCAHRSAELTAQLLAFARKQVVAPKILDLNDTIAGMLKMLQPIIGENIRLGWQPGVALWPVRIDPSQVNQILANLCVNGRDAITGVGVISIETANTVFTPSATTGGPGRGPGEYVRLTVRDTGCGMDRQTLDHLFEPFYTTKETGKGTGLGLATVYGVVTQNGGFIDVSSSPGVGTTFTIHLPRHVGEEHTTRAEVAEERGSTGRETILLVEDERPLLNLMTKVLERQGYRVLSAGTPGEALRLASDHAGAIDLLLTDVVMPEMNGRDLAKAIQERCPGLACLYASGYTDEVIAHHGVLDEGLHFIQKPCSTRDLAAKIREVLDRRPGSGRRGHTEDE